MTQPRCACGQPAPDAVICKACTRALNLALLTAFTLAADLELALSRQARFTGPGRRGSGSVLPYDERASNAAHALRSELSGWVRVLCTVNDDYPLGTVASMALWLLRRTDRIRQHPAAMDAVNGIVRHVAAAQRAIDRPAEGIYAGPCADCGHPLYVKPGVATVTCQRHDPPWTGDVAARREWMLSEAVHVLAHAAAAVHILGLLGVRVTPVQITRWVADGRLVHRGADVSGRRLLRLGDVVDLATAQAVKAGR